VPDGLRRVCVPGLELVLNQADIVDHVYLESTLLVLLFRLVRTDSDRSSMWSRGTGVEGFPVALTDGQRENLSSSGDPGDTHAALDQMPLSDAAPYTGPPGPAVIAAGVHGDLQRRRNAPGPGRPVRWYPQE
jgi:hypothetical protein